MTWILLAAFLSIAFGVMVLVSPQSMTRMNEIVNHVVIRFDSQVVKYHLGVGICLILAGIFLFGYGFYLVGK